MTPGSRWFLLFATMVSAWQESGENPIVFCYLMVGGAGAAFREQEGALKPAFVRLAACWKPSATFFMRSKARTNSPS